MEPIDKGSIKPTVPQQSAEHSTGYAMPTAVQSAFLERTVSGALEPYDFAKATVTVVLTIHPDDNHPSGRLVTVLARSHTDAPVCVHARRDELGSFPVPVAVALQTLRSEFPQRERLAKERARLRSELAAKTARERLDQKSRSARSGAKGPQAPHAEARTSTSSTALVTADVQRATTPERMPAQPDLFAGGKE